ncbi:alpha/beta fold hydrolase [Rhodococcus jostii]|uniref:Alpha/beta fold hydrolase n=1 Tax=Rhodococcus jostii TaxID=132919 RepID=A0ABU4CSD6_RHOJO|nr:alpha/beta fold hydrolase [Rhodococcus jostii]MDV6286486.1 alpha/beta fold hydrolase [Rhodococcus jostii]
MTVTRHDHVYALDAFPFQDGTILPDAKLAYSVYGTLNRERNNVILAPTWFASTPESFEWLIGPGRPLDTDLYYVVAPSMFGNGLSSSPSNTSAPFDRARFPHHSIADNIRAQHQLLTELGVTGIELVFGGSMGAMQAYEWAVRYPDLVRRVFAACGNSKTTDHCALFLSGAEAALVADQSFDGGDYSKPPAAGLRAVARVWSPWSPSSRFFWDREFEKLGFATAEEFVQGFWEPWYGALDANDFLNQLWTWQHADISNNEKYQGDLARALGDIRALTYVVPAERDPYFPVEDAAWEASNIPKAELHVIPGTWGHFSLFGSQPSSAEYIGESIRSLLAS